MQIQLNTDKHIPHTADRQEQVEKILKQQLKHLAHNLTRVEVHLSDVNSGRGGADDKRCLIEARPAGLQPITAEHRADTIDLALSGAAGQLARALERTLAKAHASEKKHDTIRHLGASDDS